MKTNISFKDQAWNRPLQSVGSRTLFYLISIMPHIFIEDSGNLKHPQNVNSINNTTGSYIASCLVIPIRKIFETNSGFQLKLQDVGKF